MWWDFGDAAQKAFVMSGRFGGNERAWLFGED